MYKEEFEGHWHEWKGKIREKWGKLTNDDISRINGKYEQFLGQLQKRYGYTKEQAEREMRNWQEGLRKGHSGREAWREDRSRNEEFRNREFERGERSRNEEFRHRESWESGEKDRSKHREDDQDFRNKKRKAG